MRAPEAIWEDLSRGNPISAQQSEMYLEILLPHRVLGLHVLSLEDKRVLANLAGALQKNHHDSWFTDFLTAPFSAKANHFLRSAIQNNRVGETDRAADNAKAAEALYMRAGNVAGAARSQVETIYAYRHHSYAKECISEIGSLKLRIERRSYTSFQVLAEFENSNCHTMLGDFDRGSQLAQRTIAEADQAHYPSLKLRALTLPSSTDSAEGRFQAALQRDADGLNLFWQGLYAPERGFQFYSDAALTAEQAGLWHLAALFQREALSMLAETDRFDLQAMAHYHLATSLRRAGDPSEAQKEFSEAYALFGKMRDGSSQRFIQANSEVELAEIEIAEGDLASAQTHLQSGAPAIEETDNFVVKLAYFNAWADLERHRNRPDQEWKYLKKTIAIARQGFTSLGSMDNRWEWYREVDRSYHRLVELELDVKHDPVQALADWEAYRAAEIAPFNLAPGNSRSRARLVARVKKLHSATLISFIVFPERVAIWVADDRGIRTFPVPVDSETLKNEAEGFLRLCSDRNSSLEKVSRSGSRLYQQLFDPIEAALTPDRTLAIEADGFLSRIPWAALVAPSGDYLSQKYMTVNTPGLFFAAPERSPKSSAGPALVAYPGAVEYEGKPYPPLPHAKEEADYVAGLFPGSTLLQEEHVTSDALMRLLPRSSAFHFAGHAVSREHGGELLLPGSEVVSSSAIRRLNLSSMNLVVLSACSTADADLDIARSPNGLVQAFLAAGAKDVVASRWDTDSQASLLLMREFYRSPHDTRDAVRAMKVSRDRMIQQKTTAHPFYWSAFELFETLNEASH